MSRHHHSLLRLEGRSSLRLPGGTAPSREPVPPDVLVELMEIRRLFEPATAALAATRATDGDLAQIAVRLEAMAAVRGDMAAFAAHDVAFHRAVTSLAGNETLMNLLHGVLTHGVLGSLASGVLARDAADVVLAEHAAIHAALEAHDPALSHAAALVHVNTTEQWLRGHLAARVATRSR